MFRLFLWRANFELSVNLWPTVESERLGLRHSGGKMSRGEKKTHMKTVQSDAQDPHHVFYG